MESFFFFDLKGFFRLLAISIEWRFRFAIPAMGMGIYVGPPPPPPGIPTEKVYIIELYHKETLARTSRHPQSQTKLPSKNSSQSVDVPHLLPNKWYRIGKRKGEG